MVVSIELTDKIDYTKKPLTIAEQIARLKQRGFIFDDESEATSYLFNISYYRLRAYTYPFQENGEDCDHNFTRKDIHFEDIIALYCFDRRLRSLISMQLKRLKWQYAQRLYKFMPKAQAIAIGTMMKVCIALAMMT